jgi:hypothetical protein
MSARDTAPRRTPRLPFSFDFGGTLIKLAFFLPKSRSAEAKQYIQVLAEPFLGRAILSLKWWISNVLR